MTIHPYFVCGSWDCGWALDVHTLSSEYIGEDPFGHPRYNTIRSEIGELMYQLKYQANFDVVPQLADTIIEFLQEEKILDQIDLILPAPPSRIRTFQPVFAIAQEVANRTQKFYSEDALVKSSSIESKSMTFDQKRNLSSTVQFVKKLKRPCNFLLIDDIFETGSTLNACVGALRSDPNTKKVFVMTMTKTKN